MSKIVYYLDTDNKLINITVNKDCSIADGAYLKNGLTYTRWLQIHQYRWNNVLYHVASEYFHDVYKVIKRMKSEGVNIKEPTFK